MNKLIFERFSNYIWILYLETSLKALEMRWSGLVRDAWYSLEYVMPFLDAWAKLKIIMVELHLSLHHLMGMLKIWCENPWNFYQCLSWKHCISWQIWKATILLCMSKSSLITPGIDALHEKESRRCIFLSICFDTLNWKIV